MNTIKNKKVRTEARFAELARTGEFIFHSKDLANLWNITQSNTLHTTVKRYIQKGLLFRVYKGMYSLKPINHLDPFVLGLKALHSYAYVSCETVLARAGVLQQQILSITLVSPQSKTFCIGRQQYRSRKLADQFLFNPAGIMNDQGVKRAIPERAVADMLYFNPRTYFDNSKKIDWKKVKKIQHDVGYKISIPHA